MQKINGPFQLVHIDGRTWSCASIDEIARIVCRDDWNRGSLSLIGDQPFQKSYSASPWNATFDKIFNRHSWIVRDDCGLIVPRWWLDRALPTEPSRYWSIERRTGDWSTYRGQIVRGTGHDRSHRSYYRHRFSTMQECREQERIVDELQEYDIKVRPRRKLPSSYDDLHRSDVRIKNWKRHRQTQYRDRPQ